MLSLFYCCVYLFENLFELYFSCFFSINFFHCLFKDNFPVILLLLVLLHRLASALFCIRIDLKVTNDLDNPTEKVFFLLLLLIPLLSTKFIMFSVEFIFLSNLLFSLKCMQVPFFSHLLYFKNLRLFPNQYSVAIL